MTRVLDDRDRWRVAARERAACHLAREAWVARHRAIFRRLIEQA